MIVLVVILLLLNKFYPILINLTLPSRSEDANVISLSSNATIFKPMIVV